MQSKSEVESSLNATIRDNPVKSAVISASIAFILFSTYKVGKHLSQYSNQLPDFIENNAQGCNHPDKERVKSALQVNKKCFQFKVNELDSDMLKTIAYYTNSSLVHYSGNCALLSACLLFNLKIGRNLLSAKNLYPILEGVDVPTAAKIIFGQLLTSPSQNFSTVDALEAEIINIFQNEGERFFIISSEGYTVPVVGACGHSLNAVVLGSGKSINVIYVDAWKTSNYLSSAKELQKRYSNGTFSLYYHKGPINIATLDNSSGISQSSTSF